MSKGKVVDFPTRTTAPITNVSLCAQALYHIINRAPHLPGFAVFYGPAGWGKSTAAAYSANKYRAYYIECKSSWTRRALFLALLKEMGIEPAKNIYQMTDQVSEQLLLSGRPLIIDEFDYLVDKNAVEAVRDIHESSNAAILLLGEEQLPHRLRKWERFHRRVLTWMPAEAATLEDAHHLARLYTAPVKIADDMIQHIHGIAHGSVGRIAVNLDMVRAESLNMGTEKMDLKTWKDRPFYTGEAPARRIR